MDTKMPSSQFSTKSYPEPDEESMEEDENISQLKWWLGVKLHVTRQYIAKLPTEMIMDLEDFSVLDKSLLREVGISPFAAKKISWLSTYLAMNDLEFPNTSITLNELKSQVTTEYFSFKARQELNTRTGCRAICLTSS